MGNKQGLVERLRPIVFLHQTLLVWLILGVKTCEVFLCFVAIVRVRAIMLSSLFSLFYVTGECHRFLHRG